MAARSSLIVFCFILINCVNAQEPLIFKVKKPVAEITISPNNNIIWSNVDNEICLSIPDNIKIAKVEVPGAKVTKSNNNCYIVRFNCGYTIGNIFMSCNTTIDIFIYQLLYDGSSSLILTKKYDVKVGDRKI